MALERTPLALGLLQQWAARCAVWGHTPPPPWLLPRLSAFHAAQARTLLAQGLHCALLAALERTPLALGLRQQWAAPFAVWDRTPLALWLLPQLSAFHAVQAPTLLAQGLHCALLAVLERTPLALGRTCAIFVWQAHFMQAPELFPRQFALSVLRASTQEPQVP